MTYEDWREQARALAGAGVPPDQVFWADSHNTLFPTPIPPPGNSLKVPKAFLELAGLVALHRDERKWSALYRALFRLTHGERELLAIEIDDDVRELGLMRKEVTRDMHKMKAFVRFRKVDDEYVAWHRPDHLIVDAMAPWFVRRFGSMRWSILTPDRCACWDTKELRFGPGAKRSDAPDGDALEELWRSYYAAVFNPARVNVKAMVKELPVRHWPTLPEAQLIPQLLADAQQRENTMCSADANSAAPFVPQGAELPVLRLSVQSCRGCELWEPATQAVFGEGPSDAKLVFVAEQPGDQEDLKGRPLIGPAGQIFDRALEEAGIERAQVYVTNAVKHFRFEERGKRRIHQSPSKSQVAACQPWLEAELGLIHPRLIVAMGRTAALSVIGRDVRLLQERGRVMNGHRHADAVMITVHPSYLLRLPDEEAKAVEFQRLVDELRTARQFAA